MAAFWSYIITVVRDDKADFVTIRDMLCGKIGKHDPLTKLSLLKAYCSSFFLVVLCGTCRIRRLMLFVLFGTRVLDASGSSHITLIMCVIATAVWITAAHG